MGQPPAHWADDMEHVAIVLILAMYVILSIQIKLFSAFYGLLALNITHTCNIGYHFVGYIPYLYGFRKALKKVH